MKEKLQKIREDAIRQIEESGDLSKLNDVRVAVLGKKGELTAVLKSMKDVSPDQCRSCAVHADVPYHSLRSRSSPLPYRNGILSRRI